MKTRFCLFVILLVTTTAFSQDIVKEPGKAAQTEILINSREFLFQGRMAIPSGGNPIDLTTNQNYVKFHPDLIESYMPFFGRAYNAGYGDTGLHFKGQPDEFSVKTKRRNYLISSTVKGENDNYRLYLTVSPDGSATLNISSNNRQTMTYKGEVRAIGKER